MSALDALRWATVGVAVVTVLIGTPQWARWYRTCTAEQWQGLLALSVLNAAVGYGTWEALHRGIPGGPRSCFVAVGMLWTLYRVAWQPATDLYRHLRRNPCRTAPGSPTMQPPSR